MSQPDDSGVCRAAEIAVSPSAAEPQPTPFETGRRRAEVQLAKDRQRAQALLSVAEDLIKSGKYGSAIEAARLYLDGGSAILESGERAWRYALAEQERARAEVERARLEREHARMELDRVQREFLKLNDRMDAYQRMTEQFQSQQERLQEERTMLVGKQVAAKLLATAGATAKNAAAVEEAPLPDLGPELKPDPRAAGTAAELIEALRRFRTWAGMPSFRAMERRSGKGVRASTMCTVLRNDVLPKRLDVIDAIVKGCGGTAEDRQKFATAWRELTMPPPADAPVRLHVLREKSAAG